MSNKKTALIFIILALISLVFCLTIRITENEWYNDIEGQCNGFEHNETCDGW